MRQKVFATESWQIKLANELHSFAHEMNSFTSNIRSFVCLFVCLPDYCSLCCQTNNSNSRLFVCLYSSIQSSKCGFGDDDYYSFRLLKVDSRLHSIRFMATNKQKLLSIYNIRYRLFSFCFLVALHITIRQVKCLEIQTFAYLVEEKQQVNLFLRQRDKLEGETSTTVVVCVNLTHFSLILKAAKTCACKFQKYS